MSWAENSKWVNARKGKPGNISWKYEGWSQKAIDSGVKQQQPTPEKLHGGSLKGTVSWVVFG